MFSTRLFKCTWVLNEIVQFLETRGNVVGIVVNTVDLATSNNTRHQPAGARSSVFVTLDAWPKSLILSAPGVASTFARTSRRPSVPRTAVRFTYGTISTR